jgi:hypothetical protein
MSLGADFNVPGGARLTIDGNLNLNGFRLKLNRTDSDGNAEVDVNGAGTAGPSINGTGEVDFFGTGSLHRDLMHDEDAVHPFIIGPDVTIQGGHGVIDTTHANPARILNWGAIRANEAGVGIALGNNFVNHGSIFVSAGAKVTGPTGPTGALVNAQGATLGGTGTFAGNVSNSGIILSGSPMGSFTISGDLTETSTAQIRVNLAGGPTGPVSNKLVVTGHANLAGVLDLHTVGTFKAGAGETFNVMSFGSATGTVGIHDSAGIGSALHVIPIIGSKSITLAILSQGPTNAPTSAGATFSDLAITDAGVGSKSED